MCWLVKVNWKCIWIWLAGIGVLGSNKQYQASTDKRWRRIWVEADWSRHYRDLWFGKNKMRSYLSLKLRKEEKVLQSLAISAKSGRKIEESLGWGSDQDTICSTWAPLGYFWQSSPRVLLSRKTEEVEGWANQDMTAEPSVWGPQFVRVNTSKTLPRGFSAKQTAPFCLLFTRLSPAQTGCSPPPPPSLNHHLQHDPPHHHWPLHLLCLMRSAVICIFSSPWARSFLMDRVIIFKIQCWMPGFTPLPPSSLNAGVQELRLRRFSLGIFTFGFCLTLWSPIKILDLPSYISQSAANIKLGNLPIRELAHHLLAVIISSGFKWECSS